MAAAKIKFNPRRPAVTAGGRVIGTICKEQHGHFFYFSGESRPAVAATSARELISKIKRFAKFDLSAGEKQNDSLRRAAHRLRDLVLREN